MFQALRLEHPGDWATWGGTVFLIVQWWGYTTHSARCESGSSGCFEAHRVS
jgi:hypothetical protein